MPSHKTKPYQFRFESADETNGEVVVETPGRDLLRVGSDDPAPPRSPFIMATYRGAKTFMAAVFFESWAVDAAA